MTPELQNKLYNDFPTIFADRNQPTQKSLLCFGLEIGDGWETLIRKLCEDIMASPDGKSLRACQVKEKFGGLRFYVYGATHEVQERIRQAEEESYKVCENCGSREGVTVKPRPYWIRTLCKKCSE